MGEIEKYPLQHRREVATCRHCRVVLKGDAYRYGGRAYHPRTNKECPANYYGGFVCSPECDYQASLVQEQSMPGHGGHQRKIGSFAKRSFDNNWE